jgi:nucleoside 2-deoxyribosyltransferase
MTKVVVCGSYGDLKVFLNWLTWYQQQYGKENVFPTIQHLRDSESCINAHHKGQGETDQTLELRSQLMRRYFDRIGEADLVVIVNEKHGKEHYGTGTTIEIGYAFAKGKQIKFTRTPTNANVLSLKILLGKSTTKCNSVRVGPHH